MTKLGHTQTIPTNQLHTHHKNPRRGDVQAIADSLRVNGQFRPIVVNRGTHTGRPMEVLAGNHTLMAARDLAEEGVSDFAELDCYVVDVDEDQATRIVLADNRTADIGSYDNEELLALLETLGDELDGTGYDEDDVDLIRSLEEQAPSLDDMAAQLGEPGETDLWPLIRFQVPPPVFSQWTEFVNGFDEPAEALEYLLDHRNAGSEEWQ